MMLELASINLRLSLHGPTKLPRWLGSAFRGGLGQHLRRLVCPRPLRACEECDRLEACLYYAAYERPYAKRGHAPPPRPLVLVPPFFGRELKLERGGRLEVGLLLMGDYARYLPHVLLALQQFGSHGLGEPRYFGQNRFEVTEARCERSGRLVYDGERYIPRP